MYTSYVISHFFSITYEPLSITNWDGEIYQVYYVAADTSTDSTYVMVPPDAKYTISGNNSTYGGGGVYVGGTFNMYGGKITGNSAKNGGGVYYTASNSLFVSGKVNITGNQDTSGADSNVYVPSSSGTPKTVPFYIGEDGLDPEAKIGVRVNDGVIATGCLLYTSPSPRD